MSKLLWLVYGTSMLGRHPRLSGLALGPLERQLTRVEVGRFGFEQAIKASAVHQVGTDQSGKGERALDGVLCCLGQPQQ